MSCISHVSPTYLPCISQVALRRGYDLAFTSTNPQHLRLMMPSGDGRAAHDTGSTKVLVAIFYSNPQKLEVHYRWLGLGLGLG